MVLEVFDLGAAGVGERVSFTYAVESKGSVFCIADEGVPEDQLFEPLHGVGRI